MLGAVLLLTAPVHAQETRQAYLQSNPAGAAILLDGTRIGETPMLVALPLGRHVVGVQRDGYVEQTRDIEVSPGSRLTLRFDLQQRGPSTLTIRFPAGVPPRLEVRVDGAVLGAGRWVATSRLVRLAVPPGQHAVELRAMGHGLQLSVQAPEAVSELHEEVTDFLARATPVTPEPEPVRAPAVASAEPAAVAPQPAAGPIPPPAPSPPPAPGPRADVAHSADPTLGILVSTTEPFAVELDAATRAACVALGFRLAPSDALRAAVHFTAPMGVPTDTQAQSLASQMQLYALLILAADESPTGTLFVQARVARASGVSSHFGEVARDAFAEWIARLAREIRGGPNPEAVAIVPARAVGSTGATSQSAPSAGLPSARPSPSGGVPLPPVTEAEPPLPEGSASFVLRNHGRSTLCELSLVDGETRTPLFASGQTLEPGAEVRLSVPAGEHGWEAVTCHGYHVRSGREDLAARTEPLTLQFHAPSVYPFWISGGIAVHGSYVPGGQGASVGGRAEVNVGYSFGGGSLGLGATVSFGFGCETTFGICGGEGHLLAGMALGHSVIGIGARFFSDGSPYFALGLSQDLLGVFGGSGPWTLWSSYVGTLGVVAGAFFGLIDISLGLGYEF